MALVVPNEAERIFLTQLTAANTWYIGLYKDGELTPSETTDIDDCAAARCDFSGYDDLPVTWLSPTTDGGGITFMQAQDRTWQHDGGGTANDVGGYYIYNQTPKLCWVEEFASPKTMADNEDYLTVRPRVELD